MYGVYRLYGVYGAYEAYEAIETKDRDNLVEELGDLLLQVYFHSRIGEEQGEFTINDVYNGVCSKLIERHPHVFGSVKAETSEQVLTNWDAIKQASHDRKSVKEQFDGVCKSLPALMLAEKYAGRAFKNGIEAPVYVPDHELDSEEAGKLLFSVAAYCKKNGIKPEEALRDFCKKFVFSLPE